MDKVTIFIPLSRQEHLQKLFAALELMDCNSKNTSLLVLVDGSQKLYLQAREVFDQSRFSERLIVQVKQKQKVLNYNLAYRRKRIASIFNEAKKYINKCDYIFIVEDDTLPPSNALSRLLRDYSLNPYAGYISGVELGRHGILHIGGWEVNDIYHPTVITSIPKGVGLLKVDAAGTYCTLTKYNNFMTHEFKSYDILGQDVKWGISMRQNGMQNYIDFNINCRHLSKDKIIEVNSSFIDIVQFTKNDNGWSQKNI